jgi:hypothetical protein
MVHTREIEMLVEYEELSGYRKIMSFGPNVLERRLYFVEGKLRSGVEELFKDDDVASTENPVGWAANVKLWNRAVKP